MLDVTLPALSQIPADQLPPLCNVTARIATPPQRVAGSHQRWEFELEAPVPGSKVYIAVHENPTAEEFGYSATDEHLLRIFKEPQLRTLLSPGETVMVQAVPRWSPGRGGLYLNVETILLVRPWRTFGRRQVDYAAHCGRKHYLAIAKGVRAEPEQPRLLTVPGMAGEIAHDLIEAAAQDPAEALSAGEAFVRRALRPTTVLRLVVLGVVDPPALGTTVARGTGALGVLRGSASLTALLKEGGPWRCEADVFHRGVSATPDLVGDRTVVELKQISPESFAIQREKLRRQVEAYLAWAMVEHGVDPVVANWRAALVNLHPKVPDQQRIEMVTARRKLIGTRIYHRHRLLALLDGGWLPHPSPDECDHCEFHRPNEEPPALPPACQYHCQVERSWACHAVDGSRECPLYEQCDRHSQYEPFERLDLFNRLRRDLLREDEEAEMAVGLVTAGGTPLGPFRVAEVHGRLLKLVPQAPVGLLDATAAGALLTLRTDGTPRLTVRFRRVRSGQWCFTAGTNGALPPADTIVDLIACHSTPFPARAQLTYLDQIQRLGEEPLVLRSSARRQGIAQAVECGEVAGIPQGIRCVIVDCPEPRVERQVLRELLEQAGATPALVLAGPGTDHDVVPAGAYWLDEFSLAEAFTVSSGPSSESLRAIATRYKAAEVFAAPWDVLFEGVLDPFLGTGKFADVVVLDAHRFPLLGLQRCFQLARGRVVLVGAAVASGPWAESVSAQASPLFQNTVRLLLETGAHALPEEVERFATVRLAARSARGFATIVGSRARLIDDVPVRVDVVEPTTPEFATFRLSTDVAPARPELPRLEMEFTTLPHHPLAVREVRQRLRLVAPAAVERFRAMEMEPGSEDRTLLGVPIRLVAPIRQLVTLEQHRIIIHMPQTGIPLVLREGLVNTAEVRAVIELARATRERRHVATSLFDAQCRAIAATAAAARVENLRVALPIRLGQREYSSPPDLILSIAVPTATMATSWPLSDLGWLAPMLIGNWAQITIVCAPEVAGYHPVIRHLGSLRS
jgi:hypothetical protein